MEERRTMGDQPGAVGDPERLRHFGRTLELADEWAIEEEYVRADLQAAEDLGEIFEGSPFEYRGHEIIPGDGDGRLYWFKVIVRRRPVRGGETGEG